MKHYVNHIKTSQSLTLIFDKGAPITIPVESPLYREACELLRNGDFDAVPNLVDTPARIENHTKGKFKVKNGVVIIGGEALPDTLSKRLLQFIEAKLPTKALEAFWHNLKHNPSEASRRELFSFLEANHVPLTEDGCFVAYKRVSENYMDIHSGKYSNKPGTVVKMKRNEVNSNRNQTCSVGLHVAAYEYAHSIYNNGVGRLVEVKVNPRDVVSVPTDYNEMKMRVCRYKVLKDCTKEITSQLYS